MKKDRFTWRGCKNSRTKLRLAPSGPAYSEHASDWLRPKAAKNKMATDEASLHL